MLFLIKICVLVELQADGPVHLCGTLVRVSVCANKIKLIFPSNPGIRKECLSFRYGSYLYIVKKFFKKMYTLCEG
jgi:hypothetical protein